MTNFLKKYMPYVFLFGVTLIVSMGFSQNPFQHYYFSDSSIYQYIGKMITEGHIPYRDVWDHKGPLVYLWHALGYKIYPMHGIYSMEVIWLFLSMVLAYKIAKEYLNNSFQALAIVIILFFTIPTNDTIGNTESLALFPLFYITYITQKYVKNKALSKTDYSLFGLICAALLLIKPLYLVFPGVFGLYILSSLIQNKKKQEITKLFLFGGLGFIIPLSVILYWLYVNNALSAFYDDYVTFNIIYTANHHDRGRGSILKASIFFLTKPVLILSIISMAYIIFKKEEYKEDRNWIHLLIAAFFITLISLIIPQNAYGHYLLIIYPLSLYLLILALKRIKSAMIIMVILEIGVMIFCYKYISDLQDDYKRNHMGDNEHKKLAAIIDKNLEKNEPFVSFLDDHDALYLYTNRPSASKYPLIRNVIKLCPKEVEQEFSHLKPKIIATSKKEDIKVISKNPLNVKVKIKILFSHLFDKDEYEVIYEDDVFIVYKLKQKSS